MELAGRTRFRDTCVPFININEIPANRAGAATPKLVSNVHALTVLFNRAVNFVPLSSFMLI